MKRYTIEEWDEGIVVRGPLPIEDMLSLTKRAKKMGFDQIDAGVAQALGATMVLTNDQGSIELRNQVEKDNAHRSKFDQWLFGSDTGMSSKTIFGVMTGRPVGEGSYPWDPDDFGRCYRLLKLFPEWADRLHEVATKYPKGWSGLVPVWSELSALFESEEYKALYDKMRQAYA